MTEELKYTAVDQETADAHWKDNARLVMTLLAVWFVITWVGALLAGSLNEIQIAGFPVGYTLGSLVTLIVYVWMIFFYAKKMDAIDEKYGMKE
ncbi:DUF4212 domain-containing protein [Dethiobacter alkaliphilus]|uniref:Membrane protein-like protein n=1 Tax=Dethiobacter alkaliphilus AHT 1 TaxID=555088 RepID=C0GHB6_DETAL|nr:DUF4212 domain-containing protein [Dethiobacter alkaliphilus]EEG77122.1 membrane protein-like protein [Dethiobacter alkaliphilus AHT 1]